MTCKAKQDASIDALSIPPPDTGNQYDVMLNLFQHLYKRRGQQQSSRDEKQPADTGKEQEKNKS